MAEIKPHFLKSIREIDGDIVELQNSITPIQNDIGRLLATRATIVELYGADTEIPPAPGATVPAEEKPALRQQRPTGEKPKRTYTKRQPRAASAAGGVSKADGAAGDTEAGARSPGLAPEETKLITVARNIPQPFTGPALAVAGGVDKKFAANKINKWRNAGWIESTNDGYQRTNKFGQFPN